MCRGYRHQSEDDRDWCTGMGYTYLRHQGALNIQYLARKQVEITVDAIRVQPFCLTF
jgi:hypothetical protein